MSIGRTKLREVLQTFCHGVHREDLPPVLGKDRSDDGGSKDYVRLERDDALQLSKVRERPKDCWSRRNEVKISGSCGWEQIRCSLQNRGSEVECPIIPSKCKLVAPDTCNGQLQSKLGP